MRHYTCRLQIIITPDWMEKMERGYLCAVLQFLLKSDQYSLPLVTLPVHLVDKDNEASLDLLCALFKHCEYHENLSDAVSLVIFSIHNISQYLVYMILFFIYFFIFFFEHLNIYGCIRWYDFTCP